MDDAFMTQLVLSSVPKRVVSGCCFQLFECVEIGSLILGMFGQGGLGPLWEGCVFGVVFNHGAVNESNISPRDDLIQEGFHGFG